jgi:hypothetical protein
MQKVSDFIDIEAPCEEVFPALTDVERRMQLSPIWGLSRLLEVSPEFPKPGSSYRVRVLADAPFGIAGGMSSAAQGAFEGLTLMLALKMGDSTVLKEQSQSIRETESPPEEVSLPKNIVDAEQRYVIAAYEPPHRLSYYLDADCKTMVTWKLQAIPRGTRINYEEVFCDENTGGENFLPTVRSVVHEWLVNIKRYSELRTTRSRIFLKKLLDRFYLKLRPDQRRTVLLIVFMQGLALATFIVAALGLGIAGLLF